MKRQAEDMLEKLPGNYIPHEVRDRLKKMGAIAPMNIFLRQEIDRMQRVISVVRSTLQDLQLAIEGTIIMSEVRSYDQTTGFSSESEIGKSKTCLLCACLFYRTFEMHLTAYMMPKCHSHGKR